MTASISLGDFVGSPHSAQLAGATDAFQMRPAPLGGDRNTGASPPPGMVAELLTIAREVAAAAEYGGRIEWQTGAPPCPSATRDALPALSLLVAEAVRNAIRHAHPAGLPGTISLGCRSAPAGEVVVEIRDDGVGLPEGFDEARHGGDGFRLMRAAAARLGGAMTYRSSPFGLCLRLPTTALNRPGHAATFAPMLDLLPTGIYLTDAAGGITWFNRAAAAIWGRRPALGERWCGSWKLRDAEGQPMAHADCPMALALREGRVLQGTEATVERTDGSHVPLLVLPALLRNETGAVTGAAGVMVEIGARKRDEQRQQLLNDELQHQIKNLFAVVGAVVAQSLRGPMLDAPRRTVLGRLQSLARNYDRVSAAGRSGAGLGEIVRDELEAFVDRVELAGPDIALNPRAAQSFALAVHELATNAAKHGALSIAGGRVVVKWGLVGDSDELNFRWVEEGGPRVTPPARKGFGSALLEGVIAQDFGNAPRILFAPAGLTYEVVASLDRISAARA